VKLKNRTILYFGVCACAVLGAMAWLTGEIVKLQRREATQEAVRRALWRMDSCAQVFVAKESSTPPLYYNSFYTPEQAYYMTQNQPGEQWTVACSGDFRVPSPLLRAESDFCKLHFQITGAGTDEISPALGSPGFPPTKENREFATNTQNVKQDDLVRAAGLMEQLKAMARPEQLVIMARNAAHAADGEGATAAAPADSVDPNLFRQLLDTPYGGQSEWSQRQQSANQARNVQQLSNAPLSMDATKEIKVSSLNPVWLNSDESAPQLVLLRTVHIPRITGPDEIVQGIWVDWPALRESMLSKVRDLFPRADLVPARGPSDDPEQLATIPAVLRAGVPAEIVTRTGGTTLYIAWGGVVAALVAVGIMMRAVIDVGERRGRFVSAVTHELRTPLTTFCLYSEMLADGMVREEKARGEYLDTLKRESLRLAKIVENVLCYARLAEVRASVNTQHLDAFDLVERIEPALSRRAGEAGMRLVSDVEAARALRVEVDPQTVERILMNLVDNACKYARGHVAAGAEQEDNRIHLTAHARPGMVEFQVADHGPGIPKARRRAVFKAFNRARVETVSSAPGLGLGLSLARGLARELGGDLRLGALPAGFRSGTVMTLQIPAKRDPALMPDAGLTEPA
jgi:hypothetical protein